MKGYWEHLDNGVWRPCLVDTKDIEEHLSSDHNYYKSLHRFTLDHEHVFNKCECGEVKSE